MLRQGTAISLYGAKGNAAGVGDGSQIALREGAQVEEAGLAHSVQALLDRHREQMLEVSLSDHQVPLPSSLPAPSCIDPPSVLRYPAH